MDSSVVESTEFRTSLVPARNAHPKSNHQTLVPADIAAAVYTPRLKSSGIDGRRKCSRKRNLATLVAARWRVVVEAAHVEDLPEPRPYGTESEAAVRIRNREKSFLPSAASLPRNAGLSDCPLPTGATHYSVTHCAGEIGANIPKTPTAEPRGPMLRAQLASGSLHPETRTRICQPGFPYRRRARAQWSEASSCHLHRDRRGEELAGDERRKDGDVFPQRECYSCACRRSI